MTPSEKTPDTGDADTSDDAATTKETTAVPVETDATADEVTTDTAADVEAVSLVKSSKQHDVSEESSETDTVEDTDPAEGTDTGAAAEKSGINWPKALAFVVLPVLALILGAAAGVLKYQDASVRSADVVRVDSIQVAKDATVRLLSYKPDTVEQDLNSARELLTGEFADSYTQLINDVVIPGSKEKQITAVATVPAAASVSAEPNEAVVLVFVNQTVMVGTDAPTSTTSSVQVTLDRVGDGWLISEFDPV